MASPSSSTSPLTFKNNELIINYHDAVIYGSDLKLIERRTEWLNDSCIHFVFTHLQQQQQHQHQQHKSLFLFMEPSVVSFWMHQCMDQDEIDDFVNNTQFPGCKGNNKRGGIISIAVNDNMSTTSSASNNNNNWQVPGSGNHWSLLVADVGVVSEERCEKDTKDASSSMRNTLRFWHFDSIRNSGNIQAAEDIAAKICLHVYPKASILTESVHQADTPQQQNGYDCGVHVLGAAKILSKYYASMTMALTTSDKGGFTGTTVESPCHRLQDLEEYLRNEIGNDSQDFCSKLRHEISSEIRRLNEERNK